MSFLILPDKIEGGGWRSRTGELKQPQRRGVKNLRKKDQDDAQISEKNPEEIDVGRPLKAPLKTCPRAERKIRRDAGPVLRAVRKKAPRGEGLGCTHGGSCCHLDGDSSFQR